MAVTSIWRVRGKGRGSLNKVMDYAENLEKTANPEYSGKKAETDQEEWLSDVINYAVQDTKTQAVIHDESAEIMRRFVSGVNCKPETARDEMMGIKEKFNKIDGVIAYHGYQSFAPGEATPEMAHEIGVKLAQKLWGERYQVVVATHLDRANHLHNHFVLNNVSMIDGKKYYRSEKDYYDMQKASDALCREYDLSVIEEPKRGKSMHYSEWQAERDGQPTWRGLVKSDMDTAIRRSMTERQFFNNLHEMGYEVKWGKDISVRPPGKERFVRLQRNFGEDYAIEGIRRRILAQSVPERRIIPAATTPPRRARIFGSIHKVRKVTGLRALYFYYLYRVGILPKKRKHKQNPKQVYFLFREDIRHMQQLSREIWLMAKYGIDTDIQLAEHKDGAEKQIAELSKTRQHLRNQARSIRDDGELESVKAEISALSAQITELRREVKSCENIERRSADIQDKLRMAHEAETAEINKTKELMKDEPFRGRR